MLRAKFECVDVDNHGGDNNVVRLRAVMGGSQENSEFFAATPSGDITLGILNQDAIAQFEVGTSYYVDFTPA